VNATSFRRDYFERLYSKETDPWRFASSRYERVKYARTLAAIRSRPLRNVFEIGCSIGILTRMLAARCNSLLAVDISETAINQARRNCRGIDNIDFRRMQIPDEWPSRTFDLIIFSEVLYFLSPEDIRLTGKKTMHSLSKDGEVLLVNWTGETDYPCQGNQAVEIFLTQTAKVLKPALQVRTRHYRLDSLTVF
jgi:2-polyprenyl-3-methyl-5-hydroxy-6-metoxy-1,4-benzoquinol methylase